MHCIAEETCFLCRIVLLTHTMESSNQILSNCQYNMTKQLEKKLQFLWNVDSYIKDAEREGNTQCAKILREIKTDEEKHARMFKQLLELK